MKTSLNSIIVPRVPWGLKILEIVCAEAAERMLNVGSNYMAKMERNFVRSCKTAYQRVSLDFEPMRLKGGSKGSKCVK